jgi:hypothetical protein
VRLEVPDSGGRHYVLQTVDAWTNNFAYVGHRATGTKAGSFLLAPPGDEHTAGDEAPVIRFPTAVASLVGRWAVDGADDLPAVRTLQAGLTLTPLGGGGGSGLPAPDPSVPEELRFLEQLRAWMQAFPPAAHDLDDQQRFAPLGLLEPTSPYAEPDPGLAAALREGLQQGRAGLEQALRNTPAPSRTAGTSPTTPSTTTSTSSRSGPSTTRPGSSRPSRGPATCFARPPPAEGCGATAPRACAPPRTAR